MRAANGNGLASSISSFRQHRQSYREYFTQLAAAHTTEMVGPMRSEDKLKLKEHTRYYYERAATETRIKNFWNWGYNSSDTLDEIRKYLPEFALHGDTDGFSEQLYFAALSQLPGNLEELSGETLLDIGCGPGEGLNFLSRLLPATRMIGLDLSQNAVGGANSRFSRGSGLTYVYGDAENVPLDDGEVDVVINIESAHTYPDHRKFLEEVARVLKPGGHFTQVDIFADGGKLARTLAVRKEVDGLEWICDKDISAEVRASIRSRLTPGSYFHRQFQYLPLILRAYVFRHVSYMFGRSFAGIPDDNYIKLLRRLRLFRTGLDENGNVAAIPPGACYRLAVARKM